MAGAAVGLVLVVDAVLVGFSGPHSRLALLGLIPYGWFVASVVGLVLALRRGDPPWFFTVFLVYGLADATYGMYLVAQFPDPSTLRLPPAVVVGHGAFGLAYALWGAWLAFGRGR